MYLDKFILCMETVYVLSTSSWEEPVVADKELRVNL